MNNMNDNTIRQEYLICYDIEDDKARKLLFKYLRSAGLRHAQKSVFWGYLTKAELIAIQRHIEKTIDEIDKVLITRTNFNQRGYSYLFGYRENVFEDWSDHCVI